MSQWKHLVKNHESQSKTNESQLKKNKTQESEIENAWPGPLCNETVNVKTDSKTLYYNIKI